MMSASDHQHHHHQLLISNPWGPTQVLNREVDEDDRKLVVSAEDVMHHALATTELLPHQPQQNLDMLLPNLVVHHQGKRYQRGEYITLHPFSFDLLRVDLQGSLLGGKGGFGAMLRSMGKGAGSKQTTDFGACRDLYGRRLRHVNDELRLKKWLEDKEKEDESRDRKRGGQANKVEERTASGIPGWHLSVPGWADIRPGKMGNKAKRMRKTAFCKDWLEARQRRPAPQGAPRWWGCPRGKECDWAHGEEELRGEGLELLRKMERERADSEKAAALDAYMSQASLDQTDVQSAVLEGLKMEAKARKKGKVGPLELYQGEGGEVERVGAATSQRVLPVSFGAGTWSTTPGDCLWLEVLSGSLTIGAEGTLSGGIVGEFATALVSCDGLEQESWYYEVEAMSAEGSVQIGWVTDHFEADAVEGDGVGDDQNSWGVDPSKMKAWTNEEEKEYGDTKWEIGDVLGVLLQLNGEKGGDGSGSSKNKKCASSSTSSGTISCFLNGKALGLAFTNLPLSASPPTDRPGPHRYYPAFSLDEGEAIRVNIGTRAFAYPPGEVTKGEAKAVAEALPAKLVGKKGSTKSNTEKEGEEANGAGKQEAAEYQKKKEKVNELAKEKEITNDQKAAAPSPALASSVSSSKAKSAAAPSAACPRPPAPPIQPQPLDLKPFKSAAELEALGLDRLKAALIALEVKCGGTLQERAARLFSLKSVPQDQIDPKLRVKGKR